MPHGDFKNVSGKFTHWRYALMYVTETSPVLSSVTPRRSWIFLLLFFKSSSWQYSCFRESYKDFYCSCLFLIFFKPLSRQWPKMFFWFCYLLAWNDSEYGAWGFLTLSKDGNWHSIFLFFNPHNINSPNYVGFSLLFNYFYLNGLGKKLFN